MIMDLIESFLKIIFTLAFHNKIQFVLEMSDHIKKHRRNMAV